MFLEHLSQYSLQGLRVFAYVASLGSVADAAEALGLTQPAISLQISNLEKQLGFELFEKRGRKNVLTSRGYGFLQSILPTLEALEQTLGDARRAERLMKPELMLGSIEGIGEYWLWRRFNQYEQVHQGVKLFLEILPTDKLEERLVRGRLSMIIATRKFEHPRVISQVLMHEKLVPVGTKAAIDELRSHLMNRKKDDHFWQRLQWVGYGDSSHPDPWAPRWLDALGIPVDQRFKYHHHVNSYHVIKQLLVRGQGVCVAPAHTVEAELDSGELVALESRTFPALRNVLYISYREGSLSAVDQEFKDFLSKAASVGDHPVGD